MAEPECPAKIAGVGLTRDRVGGLIPPEPESPGGFAFLPKLAGMLLLVRHAESIPPGPGFEDEFTRPLSDAGFRQAEQLAARLAGWRPDRLVASPYRRAIQTLEPFSRVSGLEITIDPEFREHRMAPTSIPNWKVVLQQQWNDFDFALPEGETLKESLRRGQLVLDRWRQLSGVTVLAGHGTTIALLLNTMDESFSFESHLAMPNPAVYILTDEGGSVRFRSVELNPQ